jgi:hypothetical protein
MLSQLLWVAEAVLLLLLLILQSSLSHQTVCLELQDT